MKPPAKQKRKQRRGHKRTKNPAFENPPFRYADPFIPQGDTGPIDIEAPAFDGMTGIAADLMIRSALLNATDSEKLLIAATIPIVLKFIRGAKDVCPAKPPETPPGRTDGPESTTEAE